MLDAKRDLRIFLQSGIQVLQLDLSEHQLDQLLEYQDLIAKWTRVYNLTAVRKPAEMVTHHLLDSLAAVPALRDYLVKAGWTQASLLDVGSGAGLPGVVMAICCPTLTVTCVDTVAKKAAFIKQAALALTLPNLTGLHGRVEAMAQVFDVICSRAFASLADFTHLSGAALASKGVWMAMKGKYPSEEVTGLPANINMFHVEQLTVPGLQAERCIVWMRPVL